MSEAKRYYWLKLPENFFDAVDDDTISFIEEMEGGPAYVLFYLKLLCKALRTEGVLIRYVGSRCIPYNDAALAKLTGTPVDTVHCAVKVLQDVGLIRRLNTGELFLTQMNEFVGSETDKAVAMRKSRAKANLGSALNGAKAKSDAERQRAYGAKRYVEKQEHVPLIEDYQNKTRYNGNYYVVFRRDGCKCSMCGSTDNLCVHHIDGYDKEKPENSDENKMITLCRSCHIQVHRSGLPIPENILERIGYYDSNEMLLPDCYPDVTQSKSKSKSKEKEKELEIEKEKEICSEPDPPPAELYADVEPVILNTGQEWRPTVEEYERYKRLYPAVDIAQAFREMSGWCDANPAKRKTAAGVKRFVNSWLSRDQDSATRRGYTPEAQKPAAEKPDAFQQAWNEMHKEAQT